MNDQNLKAAERLFEPAKPTSSISEYQREQMAIKANFERLRQERWARETAPVTLRTSGSGIRREHRE
jgi:hypothetical protein